MSEREHLMKQIMAERFAAIETILFLDTHPSDKKALSSLKDYVEKEKKLRAEYEKKFAPLTAFSAAQDENRWTWIDNPWPWD